MSTPAMAELLQQAIAGGADGQRALRDALAQHDDPRMRVLAEWAAAQPQPDAAEPTVIDIEPERASTSGAPDERRKLVRKLRALARELEFQRGIGDTLASALGACYLCWGDDPDCAECAGRGAPGWRDPDPQHFRDYVLPAIQRVKQTQGRPKHRPPDSDDPAQERSTT